MKLTRVFTVNVTAICDDADKKSIYTKEEAARNVKKFLESANDIDNAVVTKVQDFEVEEEND